jgi:hypothetical protein
MAPVLLYTGTSNFCHIIMSIEVLIYDAYTHRYTMDEFSRLANAALEASMDGHLVSFDEYQGQALAWTTVANEGEAAIFKLKYL